MLENIPIYVEQVKGSQVLVNVDQKLFKRLRFFVLFWFFFFK